MPNRVRSDQMDDAIKMSKIMTRDEQLHFLKPPSINIFFLVLVD